MIRIMYIAAEGSFPELNPFPQMQVLEVQLGQLVEANISGVAALLGFDAQHNNNVIGQPFTGGNDWNRDQVQIVLPTVVGRWASPVNAASFSAWVTSSSVFPPNPCGLAVDVFQSFELFDIDDGNGAVYPAITFNIAAQNAALHRFGFNVNILGRRV